MPGRRRPRTRPRGKRSPPIACWLAQVDMAMLKQHPPIRQALAGSDNPLAALLFAGLTEALQESTWLALGADRGPDVVPDHRHRRQARASRPRPPSPSRASRAKAPSRISRCRARSPP